LDVCPLDVIFVKENIVELTFIHPFSARLALVEVPLRVLVRFNQVARFIVNPNHDSGSSLTIEQSRLELWLRLSR